MIFSQRKVNIYHNHEIQDLKYEFEWVEHNSQAIQIRNGLSIQYALSNSANEKRKWYEQLRFHDFTCCRQRILIIRDNFIVAHDIPLNSTGVCYLHDCSKFKSYSYDSPLIWSSAKSIK